MYLYKLAIKGNKYTILSVDLILHGTQPIIKDLPAFKAIINLKKVDLHRLFIIKKIERSLKDNIMSQEPNETSIKSDRYDYADRHNYLQECNDDPS